jgi:hypothetical protein
MAALGASRGPVAKEIGASATVFPRADDGGIGSLGDVHPQLGPRSAEYVVNLAAINQVSE